MEWQLFFALIPRRLIDGTTAFGALMRRKLPNGEWQYRQQTEQEWLDSQV